MLITQTTERGKLKHQNSRPYTYRLAEANIKCLNYQLQSKNQVRVGNSLHPKFKIFTRTRKFPFKNVKRKYFVRHFKMLYTYDAKRRTEPSVGGAGRMETSIVF